MFRRPEPEDYYAILGVARTASFEEIRAAFRVHAKALHPDKNRHRDTKKDFQRIQEAYAILGRAEERRRYDLRAPVTPFAPPVRPTTAVPARPPRPWRKYRFASLAIPVLGLALLSYWILAPATVETTDSPPKPTELEKEMAAAVSRHALGLLEPPAEPAGVEVIGKEGRKYVLSGADYKRLLPIYERMVAESKHLQKQKEELDARRADLDTEQRGRTSSDLATDVEFRLKVNAFNYDGAAFRRQLELHTADVDDYFKQIERLAVSAAGADRS